MDTESRVTLPVADWMSGALSLQGGKIVEWIPITSSAVGVPMGMLHRATSCAYRHRPAWSAFFAGAASLLSELRARPVHDTLRLGTHRTARTSGAAAVVHFEPRQVSRCW